MAANCEVVWLNPDQATSVTHRRNQRNLDRCLAGEFQCDPFALTEAQRIAVHETGRKRTMHDEAAALDGADRRNDALDAAAGGHGTSRCNGKKGE